MATKTISGFIYLDAYNNFEFFRSPGMDAHGYAKVMPHTITVELPEGLDRNAGIAAVLERKRAAALDEAAKAERELEQLRQVASKTN